MDIKPDMFLTHCCGPSITFGMSALRAESTAEGGLIITINGREVAKITPDRDSSATPMYFLTSKDIDFTYRLGVHFDVKK